MQNNESFVVINPASSFSCYQINQAKFVTAAPQLTFSGSNYIELRYRSTSVDGIGISGQSNTSTLANVSLYRKNNVSQPTPTFNISEWDSYPSDYCQNLGTLSTSDAMFSTNEFKIYPNPVLNNIFVHGKLDQIKTAEILDSTGKLIYTEKYPFKQKDNISVDHLTTGNYLLKLNGKVYQFIKK